MIGAVVNSVHTDPSSLSERVDLVRLDATRNLDPTTRAAAGQFFTPMPVAEFMASLFTSAADSIRLLDAGAGIGSLTAAFVQACAANQPDASLSVTAYESDPQLVAYLKENLAACASLCADAEMSFASEVVAADFLAIGVERAHGSLFADRDASFTHAILNPPYGKIGSDSRERRLVRALGVEVGNLYTAFLAVAVALLAPGGELVAIIPRSFTNGPYFKPFRTWFLREMRLTRIHVFAARDQAFRDDDVLQETVIIHAVKGGKIPARVVTTVSAQIDDDLVSYREVAYDQLVRPDDPDAFIHIVPDARAQQVRERMQRFTVPLGDLGLSVSTGKVVDFRARGHLRDMPGVDTAPLIYPTHFESGFIRWPKVPSRKPNALAMTEATSDLLVPAGTYVLVKRFSAKEEPRRIVATVYDAARVSSLPVGFENHLNYYHIDGHGLPMVLAKGLAIYLNSTLVDAYFRQFNGHTQVNATDLRSLPYPTQAQLETLGAAIGETFPPQEEIDALMAREGGEMPGGTNGDNPIQATKNIELALSILRQLGFPRQQQNERSALTLLALLDLKPETPWVEASDPMLGITPMMEFFAAHYGKTYKPNTRETVRRQTVHQFLDAGLIIANPDRPDRPTNSPQAVYQIEADALALMRTFGTDEWEHSLAAYQETRQALAARYAREREMRRIPIILSDGMQITLSPGGQNILVEQIVTEFCPRFTPGGTLFYVGDTDEKFAHFDREGLAALGVTIEEHGKMPDVIVHYTEKNWLVLIEAVTSHGPVDAKRHAELATLFGGSSAGLVFVTAFLSRRAMVRYLGEISWETEVWVADAPSHMIHFNGERFLGPHR